MNCAPFKSRTIVGRAAPIAVYNMFRCTRPLQVPLRGGLSEENTTHEFYRSQEDRECEGEYDAPELPIFWHTMVTV